MIAANVCTGIAVTRAMRFRKTISVSASTSASASASASSLALTFPTGRRNTVASTPTTSATTAMATATIVRKIQRKPTGVAQNNENENNTAMMRPELQQASQGDTEPSQKSVVNIQIYSACGRAASSPDITQPVVAPVSRNNPSTQVRFTPRNSVDPRRAYDNIASSVDSPTASISTNTAINLSTPSSIQSTASFNASSTVSAHDTRGVNRMLVLVCLSFVVLYAPAFVFQLVDSVADIWVQSYSDTRSHLTVFLAWQTSVTLLYTHHATNFVLYMLSAREFRREFVALFGYELK